MTSYEVRTSYEEHDPRRAEEFDAGLLEDYLVDDASAPQLAPRAFADPAPRHFATPEYPSARSPRPPEYGRARYSLPLEYPSGSYPQPLEYRPASYPQARLTTARHRIPPMPIMSAPPSTARSGRSMHPQGSPRPATVTVADRPARRPTHAHESSVNSPWTFATGASSLHSASAAVARWPLANKLHVAFASALMLVAFGVLIASAVVARSGTHNRTTATNQPAARVEPSALPRGQTPAPSTKPSAVKITNAAEGPQRVAATPVRTAPPAGVAPPITTAPIQRAPAPNVASAPRSTAAATTPPIAKPTISTAKRPAAPRPAASTTKPESKPSGKSLEDILSELGDQQLGQ